MTRTDPRLVSDPITRAALDAADAIAIDLISDLDIDTGALAIVILGELYRQRRRYYDRLNETATVDPRTQPEPLLDLEATA